MSGKKPKDNPARAAYRRAYSAEHYERINLSVKKGKRDQIKAAAKASGMTVSGYITQAIEAYMHNH